MEISTISMVKPISASIGKTSKQGGYTKITRTEVGSIFNSKSAPEFMDCLLYIFPVILVIRKRVCARDPVK